MSKFILASASPRRIELLSQINVTPDKVCPADIDENVLKGEKPEHYVTRLARQKAAHVAENSKIEGCYVLAADTAVACGRQILDKTQDEKEARGHLRKLSGRRHKVFGGICLMAPDGKTSTRLVTTRIAFKRLDDTEMAYYLESKDWEGKAGGYGIQGLAGAFVKSLNGSYTNVVGLCLYTTSRMLVGAGYPLYNQKDDWKQEKSISYGD